MADKGQWLMQESGIGPVNTTFMPITGAFALDVNILGGVIAGVFNQGIMVRNVANVWTDVGYFAGNLQVPVALFDGVNTATIEATWVNLPGDERDDALAVASVCHGHMGTEPLGQQVLPFLVDLDDDAITAGQIPQLVISELYGYETSAGTWNRVLVSAAGHLMTTANIEGDYVDDSLFTVAVDRGLAVGGVFTTDQVDANDFGVFRIDANRHQYVNIMCDEVGGGTIVQLPLYNHAFASANYDLFVPSGGVNYVGPPFTAYLNHVDANGAQYSVITDTFGINAEVAVDFVAAFQTESANALMTASACYGSYAAGLMTQRARPFVMDLEDDNIAVGQILHTQIGLNYGVNSAGNWARVPLVADADAITTGSLVYGFDRVAGTIHPIPLVQDGQVFQAWSQNISGYDFGIAQYRSYPLQTQATMSADYVKHVPVGGVDYRTANPTAYEIDVDNFGRQSIRHQGTDRYGNMPVSPADVTESLKVIQGKQEIWSDDYKLWYDECETRSGAGCRMCKWLGGLNEPPFNQGLGTSTINYVEGGYNFMIPPKEGNWMLELKNVHPSEHQVVGADAYTKLGEIDEKRMSIELWWTGCSFDPGESEFNNVTAFCFGFYHYSMNAIATQTTRRTFLVRLLVPGAAGGLPRWEYYNNAGGWTAIDDDARQVAGLTWTPWNDDDRFCWQYSKLTINLDYENDGTYQYESLTVNDTTWPINADCETTALGVGVFQSALVPYLYSQFSASLYDVAEEEWQGFTYVDQINVWANDMQNYGAAATAFGQKSGPGA